MSSAFSSTGSGRSVNEDGESEVARVLTRLGHLATGESDGRSRFGGGCYNGQSFHCDNININVDNNYYNYYDNKSNGKQESCKTVGTEPETVQALSLGLGLGLDLGSGIKPAIPLPFDLNVDQAEIYQEDCENISCPNSDTKFEKVSEPANPGPARCAPQTRGRRSRQNLTEAEKEARKIRRILANRESARQTIRRRQAMHEELIQKAANLASENENLKRRKELAVKEFKSLKKRNQTLKAQMSHVSGESHGYEAKSSVTDTQNVWPGWPFFMYSTHSPAFTWPSCSCSHLNLCQFSSSCMLHKNQNDNNALANWCVLPYSWIIPTPPKYSVEDKDGLVDNQTIPSQSPFTPKYGKAGSWGTEIANFANGKLKSSERVVKASGGAEARKRRRELLKLKSLRCHTV